MPIRDISDTARWVAAYRALESERPDALFADPYARRLAGDRGMAIVETFRQTKRMAAAIVIRTRALDEMVLEIIARERISLVLNLAAGLDTRPYRLALPSGLAWIEVDLPDLMAYKDQVLAGESPRCRLERRALDLSVGDARAQLLSEISRRAQRILVMTEGLLMYLYPDQVAELAREFRATPAIVSWLFDQMSPRVRSLLTASDGNLLRAGGSELRFAPAEGTAFFQPLGWRERQYRATIDECRRLGRPMPGTWIWIVLSRFSRWIADEGRRAGGIVELRPGP